jgi:hypothetical protein
MIEPASPADWTVFALMAACLSAYATVGYRYVVAVAPGAAVDRLEQVADRTNRAA